MDAARIEPLIHDWLIHFQKIVQAEEESVKAEADFCMPFIGISTAVVNAIFQITEYLELGLDTRYLTIHLYDKFMYNYFWEVYKAEIKNGPTESSWLQTCKTISGQSKLYLMSCMQLASKMDSHSMSLRTSQIISVLQQIDTKCTYTQSAILSSEFKVFKTVGFKIPLYTPLHCIEILLALTGLQDTPSLYSMSIDLLDIVYLKHRQLYSHLECLVREECGTKTESHQKNMIALQTNILYLGASIILSATCLLCSEDNVMRAIASKLSKLTDMKETDIWTMVNILCLISF